MARVSPSTKSLKDRAAVAAWFVDTFSSSEGKKVVDFLRKRFYCDSTTAGAAELGSVADLQTMAFREGQRSVVLFIAAMADYNLSAARKAIHEAEESAGKERDEYAV